MAAIAHALTAQRPLRASRPQRLPITAALQPQRDGAPRGPAPPSAQAAPQQQAQVGFGAAPGAGFWRGRTWPVLLASPLTDHPGDRRPPHPRHRRQRRPPGKCRRAPPPPPACRQRPVPGAHPRPRLTCAALPHPRCSGVPLLNREEMSRTVRAVLLAGGETKNPLTRHRAMPAVPLGSSLLMVDVPLNNCLQAGINKMWVWVLGERCGRHGAGWVPVGAGVWRGAPGRRRELPPCALRMPTEPLPCSSHAPPPATAATC